MKLDISGLFPADRPPAWRRTAALAALGVVALAAAAWTLWPRAGEESAAGEGRAGEAPAKPKSAAQGLFNNLKFIAGRDSETLKAQSQAQQAQNALRVEAAKALSKYVLKGVFVNVKNRERSMAIVERGEEEMLVVRKGDSIIQGAVVQDIYPDRLSVALVGDKPGSISRYLNLPPVTEGEFTAVQEASLADNENIMGTSIYDPSLLKAGSPEDIFGANYEQLPVIAMPIPAMPVAPAAQGPGASRVAREMAAAAQRAKKGEKARP